MSTSDPTPSGSEDRAQRFIALLSACDRRLYNYILSLVSSFHDADDIAQETKTRLWQQFDQYDESKDFGSWACTIAYYEVLHFRDRTESQRKHFSPQFVEAVADELQTTPQQANDYEDALVHCVRKLDAAGQEMLRLIYVAGLPMEQVAQKTARTLSAAYQAAWRLRKALRECIERRLRQEGNR